MSDILILDDGSIVDEYQIGIDYLGSIVTDFILNSVMSDLYSPGFGTQIKKLPQQNIDSRKAFEMSIMIVIEEIETQVKSQQAMYPPKNKDEKLKSLHFVDLKEGEKRWTLILKIVSESGVETDLETLL